MKRLRFLYFLVLVWPCTNDAIAQSDIARINRLLDQCYHWQYQEPDSIVKVAQKAIQLAAVVGYKSGEARAWYYLGHAKHELHAYDTAILALQQAISLFDEKKDASRLAAAYNIKSISLKNLADYTNSLEAQLQAIRWFEKASDTAGLIIAYNNIGILYNDQGKITAAEAYLNRALKLAEKISDEYLIVTSLSNIALNYNSQRRYVHALDIFKKVLQFDLKDGNFYEISTSYNNLASSYLKLQLPDSALILLDSALFYKRLSGDKYGQVICFSNLAETHDTLRQYRKSLLYLDSASKLAHEISAKRLQKDIYAHYFQVYNRLGMADSALLYLQNYVSLKDSLQIKDTEVALINVQRRFDLEQIDQELREANLELNSIKATQKLYLFGFLFILLLALVFGFAFFRFRKLNNALKRNQEELESTNQILQQLNQQLEISKAEAESANKAKSAFLSNVSHEIRTPLNAILGLLELMSDSLKGRQQAKTIETIRHSADSLLHIINDLLDLSKIEAGKIDFQSKSFCFHELMAQIENTLKALALEKSLKVSTHIDSNIPTYLKGDQYRLNQILLNLGGNAIKFTAKGEVLMQVFCVPTMPGECRLRFEIKDTGIGIPTHRLESIFDRFSQADEQINRKFGGTGLGLSICKKLVELQGGQLGVESQVSVGSTFWFELTFDIPSTQHSISKTFDYDTTGLFEGKRVLIIDDNSLNLKLAQQIVKRWKMRSLTAKSGIEALNILASDMDFDLVLLDIHMPEMNGFETYEAMKKLGFSAPVIALTADTYEETRQGIIRQGIPQVVLKPYNASELKKSILAILKT